MRVRTRYAELAAALAGAGLFAITFAPWFDGAAGELTAWEALVVTDVVVAVVGLTALGFALASLTRISISVPLPGSVITTELAFLAAVLIGVRIVWPPDDAALESGIWAALALSVVLVFAGWLGMQEETPTHNAEGLA